MKSVNVLDMQRDQVLHEMSSERNVMNKKVKATKDSVEYSGNKHYREL